MGTRRRVHVVRLHATAAERRMHAAAARFPDDLTVLLLDAVLAAETDFRAATTLFRHVVELDPGWCDVVRDRYAAYTAATKGGC